jgi:hypothetical protein
MPMIWDMFSENQISADGDILRDCRKSRFWQTSDCRVGPNATKGHSVSDIRNKLGHEDIQATMVYLQLDLSKRKNIQNRFIQYVQSNVTENPEIDALIDWQNKDDIMAWLDETYHSAIFHIAFRNPKFRYRFSPNLCILIY